MARSWVENTMSTSTTPPPDTPQGLLVRSYQDTDQAAVARLYDAGLLAGQIAPNDSGADLDYIHEAYFEDPRHHLWIAEHEGQILGMIGVASDEEHTAEIRRLRVDSAYQSSGIAAVLLETAIAHCKHHGYLKIRLDTRFEKDAAVAAVDLDLRATSSRFPAHPHPPGPRQADAGVLPRRMDNISRLQFDAMTQGAKDFGRKGLPHGLTQGHDFPSKATCPRQPLALCASIRPQCQTAQCAGFQVRSKKPLTPTWRSTRSCRAPRSAGSPAPRSPQARKAKTLGLATPQDALARLPDYLCALHHRGVHYKAIHLDQIVVQADGSFVLLDIQSTRFYARPLSLRHRLDNFFNTMRYPEDLAALSRYGLARFFSRYLQGCRLSEKHQAKLIRKLRNTRRFPELRRPWPGRDLLRRRLARRPGSRALRGTSGRAPGRRRRPRGSRPGSASPGSRAARPRTG